MTFLIGRGMRTLVARCAVAFTTVLVLLMAWSPAWSDNVNGRNVTVVRHAEGSFTAQGNGTWIEADAAGKPGFTFVESARDDWSVYLKDATRNVDLQLDLHQKKIFYSDASNNKAPLYDITEAAGMAAAPPQTAASGQQQINGRSVNFVRHAEGSFTAQGNGTWIEADAAGKPGFTFVEAARDDWSVYLKDATRNVDLQLDLHQKKIFYSDASNNKAPLYDIAEVAGAATAPPQPAASGQQQVNGRTVSFVSHAEGSFTAQGNGTWIEADAAGKPGFTFVESARDDWSVYLKDTTRNVDLQLDLHQKKIFYSDASNNKAPLYDITNASAPLVQVAVQPAPAPQPSAPAASHSITGRNVTQVMHSQGSFRSRGDGTWEEADATGQVGFVFQETGRDDWSVYLKDTDRNVTLQLDLFQKKIFYSDASNNKAPLYDITNAAAPLVQGAGQPVTPPATPLPGGASASQDILALLPQNDERQCITNKAGSLIAVNVKWYRPTDFEPDANDASKVHLSAAAVPVQEDKLVAVPLPGKNRSCVQQNVRMTAVVRVIGAKVAARSVKLAAGTIVAIGGAVVCVGTEGAGCPAAAAAITTVATGGIEFLPDAEEGDFYVGAPGELEVFGTAFNPGSRETRPWGTGAAVGRTCEENSDCANGQCGRMSSSDADDGVLVCCPQGSVAINILGKHYCTNIPNGAQCRQNRQCASQRCKGNGGTGITRGVCK